jgi:hypothetical protein
VSARAAAGLLVSALVRRTEAAGGHAMVLAKGDAVSGAMLLVIAERGQTQGLVERTLDMDGRYRLTPTGPKDAADLTDYIARRRRNDPDLWVVELDCAGAVALAGEVLGG